MDDRYFRAFKDGANFVSKGDKIPMVYFNGIPNVGDLINPYLVTKITGRRVYRAQTNRFPHLRAVGSVLGSASSKSYIWGGGSIDGKQPARPIDPKKIRALRGMLTRDVVRQAVGIPDFEVPLGDPALLMPRYFQMKPAERRVRLGLVPHFVDLRHELISELVANHNAEVIDVRQEPEAFITQISNFDMILSSSLHGLILADAYGIRNKWIRIGPGIIGGTFKFIDYYSVTDSPAEEAAYLRSPADWLNLSSNAERVTSVKRFLGNQNALLDAFPKEVLVL